VSKLAEKEDLKKLKFENGDIIPDVESYFITIKRRISYK
jgi:hypothetical protein